MLNNYGLGINLFTKDSMSNVFSNVGNKFSSMFNMFKSSGGQIPGIFGKLGGVLSKGFLNPVTLGITAAVVAFTAFVKIVGEAMEIASEFEYGMAKIATLLEGDTVPKIEMLTGVIEKMQMKYGQSAKIMQEGLYETIGTFGETVDNVKQLEIATKASVAGMSTVKESISMLATVSKGYGDTSNEMLEKVSDLAFMTANLGVTTFPELASEMGRVVPLSKAMNVSLEDLFGTFATLTGVTGNTSEVSTQLASILGELMKPSKEMQSVFDVLGYKSGSMMVKEKGLIDTLMILKKAVGDNDDAFVKLFGRKEAIVASLALLNSQYDVFVEKSGKMKDAIGSTEIAFKKMSETDKVATDRLRETTAVFMQKLGRIFLPIKTAWTNIRRVIMEGAIVILDTINKYIIAPFKEVLGPRVMMTGAIFKLFGFILLKVFQGSIIMMGLFLKGFLLPFKIGNMLILGVAKALEYLKSKMSDIGAFFVSTGTNVWEGIKGFVLGLYESVKPIIDWIYNLVSTVMGYIIDFLNPVINVITKFVNIVKGIFSKVVDFLAPFVNAVLEGLKFVLKPVVELAELAGIVKKGTADKWFTSKFSAKVEGPDITSEELKLGKNMPKPGDKDFKLTDEQLKKIEEALYGGSKKGSKEGSKEGVKEGMKVDIQGGWEMDFLIRNFIPVR